MRRSADFVFGIFQFVKRGESYCQNPECQWPEFSAVLASFAPLGAARDIELERSAFAMVFTPEVCFSFEFQPLAGYSAFAQ
jgi:hypothetical protein